MQRLRSRLGAWWLLLLLGRVLAPEAAVLSLHAHHHTVEASHRPAVHLAHHHPEAEVSPQHRHCHAEQFYDVAFQPGLPPLVPQPRVSPAYPAYRPAADLCPARHLLPGAALRGPPVG